MPRIVLATLNARFIHTAFGLRYLLANLGPLRPEAALLEFEIHQSAALILEQIVSLDPAIVGFGVYIWNVHETAQVVAALKQIRPKVIVILGGPEVSYPSDFPGIVELADHVITGEADLKFAEVCQQLLDGNAPGSRIIPAALPDLAQLTLPYQLYSSEDLAHRVLYLEASRGCPFSCEFCLSSLDIPVRQFPLASFLAEVDGLLRRGARQFKFVDRTFNLNLVTAKTILQFFLERYRDGLFFHFEMVPDRLPEGLRQILREFPAGSLQFEVGIQTFNAEVSNRIHRRQDYPRLEDNLRFLRAETAVYLHVDLIVGLPGETWQSFATGFDRLIALGPQEIQVGLLKRLRGTPMIRHDQEWGMVYNPNPPYEILQTAQIDFQAMQRLRRFARFWDLIGNSGNFIETTPLLWAEKGAPFEAFISLADHLFARFQRTDSIALDRLAESIFEYLIERGLNRDEVGQTLARDYGRGGRKNLPGFLEPYASPSCTVARGGGQRTLKRQSRRLSTG